MMKRSIFTAMLALLAGCGTQPPVDQTLIAASATGPHGGPALELPDKQGFVEILVETAPDSTKAVRRVVLAAYFLGPDLKSPLSPGPRLVTASIVTPENPAPKPVPMSPDAKPKSAGGIRFASLPGDFEYDELYGELSIELGGQKITRPFKRF